MTMPGVNELILILLYPISTMVTIVTLEEGVNELIWILLLCPILILGTIVILFIIRQRFETKRAMISGGHEEAYRKLAEQAVEAQQKYVDEQQKVSEGIDDLRNRVAAIEKILREVD
ncbi:MAG: hypothetical protein IBX69_15015 [Anaerolineales bacterium]|nr:hypothetical protein [Anaerolineales bacterium]